MVSVVSLCLVSWHCYSILVVWCGGGISFPLCFGASKLFGSCVDLFCLRVGVVSLKPKEPGRFFSAISCRQRSHETVS